MDFDKVLQLDSSRLVVSKIRNSANPIVFYGASNCAESLYKTISKYGILPKSVFVDDPFHRPGSTFQGVEIKRFTEISKLFDSFDIAIAIGTSNPELTRMKSESHVHEVFGNVGYARGLAIDEAFANEHWDDLRKIYNNLADDFSRHSLVAFLESKLYGNPNILSQVYDSNQYFGLDFLNLSNCEVLADCGAFTGDTIRSFLENVKGNYHRIYAWEPDSENLASLNRYVTDAKIKSVSILPLCVYSEQGTISFDSQGSSTSFVSGNGRTKVACDTVDNCCCDSTFIKIDVEGSEMEALKGAAKTIKSNKPKLAVAAYHRREDVFEIPNYLLSLRGDYRIYFRAHRPVADDFVLYAV